MCSNNTGVRGNVGNGGDYESSRKLKKQRIPKRGPGVAELEKILREQEKIDGDVQKGKMNIGGISAVLPKTYPPSFASSSNSLPRNVYNFLGNSPPFPPVTAIPGAGKFDNTGNLKVSSQLGCGDILGCHANGHGRSSEGVYIGGSGIFLPEQALLPITWSSSETRKVEEPPKMTTDHFSFPLPYSNGSGHSKMFPSPMFQNNHGTSHPSMMNLNHFPKSAISSSSTPPPPPSSSAGEYYHDVEHPSNQKACHHYTSNTFPDEQDKMIGAKRLRPDNFRVDNWVSSSSHMPCQNQYLLFHDQTSGLDHAPSSSNHGHVFNLGTASRDPMPENDLLELKAKTCVANGNAMTTLGSPTTPLPSIHQNCQPKFSNFIKQFPFQERKENSEDLLFQRSSLSESEASSVQKKSFFSFLLQPEEQKLDATEPTLGLKSENYCTDQKTGDLIDLSLKL